MATPRRPLTRLGVGVAAGWNKAKRTRFLETLALTANVRASERAALVPAGSAYRERAKSAEFRRDWEQALREGYGGLELALLDRAINGVEVTTVGADGKSRRRREFSEKLALQLLSQHRATVTKLIDADAGESAKDTLARKLALMAKRLGDPA